MLAAMTTDILTWGIPGFIIGLGIGAALADIIIRIRRAKRADDRAWQHFQDAMARLQSRT
jgi:hypothetical protein